MRKEFPNAEAESRDRPHEMVDLAPLQGSRQKVHNLIGATQQAHSRSQHAKIPSIVAVSAFCKRVLWCRCQLIEKKRARRVSSRRKRRSDSAFAHCLGAALYAVNPFPALQAAQSGAKGSAPHHDESNGATEELPQDVGFLGYLLGSIRETRHGLPATAGPDHDVAPITQKHQVEEAGCAAWTRTIVYTRRPLNTSNDGIAGSRLSKNLEP